MPPPVAPTHCAAHDDLDSHPLRMTDPDPSTRNAHDVSGSADRYETLVEVLEHEASKSALDRRREEAERRRRQKRTGPYWAVAALAVLALWLWVFPPAFLRVQPPPPQPVVAQESALRIAMYAQAQRIRAFREETGRLPDRLEETGPPLPGMTYRRLAPGLFQLTGETRDVRLTYRSDLPLDEFLASGAGPGGGG